MIIYLFNNNYKILQIIYLNNKLLKLNIYKIKYKYLIRN